MAIVIEKDIPIPERAPFGRVYDFASLKVGDSFLSDEYLGLSAANSASRYKRLHPGWDFKSVTIGTRRRIWRTA